MNMNEFDNLCTRYAIAPSIALENQEIVQCLINSRDTQNDDAKRGYRNILIQLLEGDF
jgi:hypothetical protein